MSAWYILPNGHVRHVDGLEIQPENDWFPTEESLLAYTDEQLAAGHSEAQIARRIMSLAVECEQWVQENLS